MIHSYVRVSTPHQKLDRQIANVLEVYPTAQFWREHYTGVTMQRPVWEKLMKQLEKGDVLVCDSVSRFSRNATEGYSWYKSLYEKGIEIVFLNEPTISTSIFDRLKSNLINIDIKTGNSAVDTYFKGNVELINSFLMMLAEEQIKVAFEQAQKEVDDLHTRISQGIREAKKQGKHIGGVPGIKVITKKSIACKAIIRKHSKDFGGSLEDLDVIRLCGCNRNSYYKYKREIKSEIA